MATAITISHENRKRELLVALEALKLFDGARPVRPQEPRKRTVGEKSASCLAVGTVVGFVGSISNPLDACLAANTWFLVATMNRHALAKSRYLFGETHRHSFFATRSG